jgi:hypothetical protein
MPVGCLSGDWVNSPTLFVKNLIKYSQQDGCPSFQLEGLFMARRLINYCHASTFRSPN